MLKTIIFTLAIVMGGIGLLGLTAHAGKNEPAPSIQNKTPGDIFLENNKKKPGVILLADGLQYKILIQGNGPKPVDSDTVTVDYVGTLIDGTEFDSSYKRKQSATFPVSGVIPGWTEALKLMPVGSTWELYIPASLAYGEEGAPPAIGPNQTLIFKVNLISINK
jgi:FKBP-type peptidyl-prolyl cis-trans isomerase FklB